MGDTTTPVLGLVKPEVGASRSTWGTKWNGNADNLDSNIGGLSNEIGALQSRIAALENKAAPTEPPIGSIIAFPMSGPMPAGYTDCAGELLSVTQFPALFAVLGTRYGGDGVSTFAVPDFRGCVLAHLDGGTGRLGGVIAPDTPGAIGGAAFVALDINGLPSHQHAGSTDAQGDHSHGYAAYTVPAGSGFAIGAGAQLIAVGAQTDGAGSHSHNIATSFSGGGAGHLNVQTTALVMWIIRVY